MTSLECQVRDIDYAVCKIIKSIQGVITPCETFNCKTDICQTIENLKNQVSELEVYLGVTPIPQTGGVCQLGNLVERVNNIIEGIKNFANMLTLEGYALTFSLDALSMKP